MSKDNMKRVCVCVCVCACMCACVHMRVVQLYMYDMSLINCSVFLIIFDVSCILLWCFFLEYLNFGSKIFSMVAFT